MTPAQRNYDTDLVASMRQQAVYLVGRSRKVSDTLNSAADRIEELSALVPVDPPVMLDAHGHLKQTDIKQPASTPEAKKGLGPAQA